MKNPEKNRDIWYQLDNAANIFPAVSDDNNTNVFRISCELQEPVDRELLQKSVDTALESFPYFRVVLRRGLFWYYLERTNLRPTVELESGRPCKRIFYRQVKELLFQVTYFENRINVEMFHVLSDGAGAFDFLRAILVQYLNHIHRDELPEDLPPLEREPPPAKQGVDGFQHHYDPAQKASPFKHRAYTISGTLLPSSNIRVISASMSTKAMLALAKSRGVTVTAYLASLMICAIYEEMMPRRAQNRTINVIVPVDLRGYYSTETSRNFFTTVDVGYNFALQGGGFAEVLEDVSRQLHERISPGALAGRLNYNMAMRRHPASRFTPLILKNRILQAAYVKAETTCTCALSNLGRITMPEPYVPYIKSFHCLLNPTRYHRWKACVASFEDTFIINFTSCIAETDPHKYMVRHLSEAGIDICITSNGGDEDEVL